MTAPAAALPAEIQAVMPDAKPQPNHHTTFHEVLSALNPLQYLPVIGTIYRAVTGDTIPEAVRRIGSVVVSALMGGPVGVAINLASFAAEKATGIDLDHIGQSILRGDPIDGKKPAGDPPVMVAQRDSVPEAQQAGAPKPEARRDPWSPAQLTAYGVTASKTGTLRMAGLEGADVLNSLELSRIQMANAAYGTVMAWTVDPKPKLPPRATSIAWNGGAWNEVAANAG